MRRAIACFTLLASTAYAVSAGEVTLRGYTPEHAAAEMQWEQKFREMPDPAKVRENMRRMDAVVGVSAAQAEKCRIAGVSPRRQSSAQRLGFGGRTGAGGSRHRASGHRQDAPGEDPRSARHRHDPRGGAAAREVPPGSDRDHPPAFSTAKVLLPLRSR